MMRAALHENLAKLEAGAFDLREQFICFFDFSSCPRQTGLAKPRPFLRKLTRDLYVQQSKRDHP